MTKIICDCCGSCDDVQQDNFPVRLSWKTNGPSSPHVDACFSCVQRLNEILKQFHTAPEKRDPKFTAYLLEGPEVRLSDPPDPALSNARATVEGGVR